MAKDNHGRSVVFVGKGFGDVEAEWLRPIAVTGEIDYTWSTHQNDFLFGPIADTLTVTQTPTVPTYGAPLQYSLLYMNANVHEVPEFFRNLIPTPEVAFATRILAPRSLERSLERTKPRVPGGLRFTTSAGLDLLRLNLAPGRPFQLIRRVADMSALWRSWISSWTTCSPIRLENLSSGPPKPAAPK
jgi:hypothetical protein